MAPPSHFPVDGVVHDAHRGERDHDVEEQTHRVHVHGDVRLVS